MTFEKILKEVKKLNQARRFNNSLNGQGKNEKLAQLNSSVIRAELEKLKKLMEV
jgi:hypothetical protein